MIRQAALGDMEEILAIFGAARQFMRENGNPGQWGNTYPPRAVLEADMQRGQLYVCGQDGALYGAFVLMDEPDPAYAFLEEGSWAHEGPYGTIHRVASNGAVKGVFRECLEFCKARYAHLRIDTHPDNHVMQRLIEKGGFQKRGLIIRPDDTPRIVYEYAAQG